MQDVATAGMSARSKTQDGTPPDYHHVIQCQSCFRTFYTPAQFGQHSRSCGEQKRAHRFLSIGKQTYKYSYLEKQSGANNFLEIKTRFLIERDVNRGAPNGRITNWKQLANVHQLRDRNIETWLKSHQIENVNVSVRNRKESGLVIANFIRRNVAKTAEQVHAAKICIETAVDIVRRALPPGIILTIHVCRFAQCRELVIRDTEGFCSRHRAQKYHRKGPKLSSSQNIIINEQTTSSSSSKLNPTQVNAARTSTRTSTLTSTTETLKRNTCVDDDEINMNSSGGFDETCATKLRLPYAAKSVTSASRSMSSTPSMFTPPYDDDDNDCDDVDIWLSGYPYDDDDDGDVDICTLKPLPLALQQSSQPNECFLRVSAFFAQHCYIFQTPASLCDVSIKDSLLTLHGINLLSVNYATHVPDVRQILRKDDCLIAVGARQHVAHYLGLMQSVADIDACLVQREKSIRFKQFIEEMITYYVLYVAVPADVYGCTVSEIPFARYGVNVISVNLKIDENPSIMSHTRLSANDMLLCSFNRADDKHRMFCQAAQSISIQKQ